MCHQWTTAVGCVLLVYLASALVWSGLLIPKHEFPLLCGISLDRELTIKGCQSSVFYECLLVLVSFAGKANGGTKVCLSWALRPSMNEQL